jgi:hypothetical protein
MWRVDLRNVTCYIAAAMRGFLQPALKKIPSESQLAFAQLSRHRRAALADAAQTTLLKASQWSRGDAVASAVAEALEKQTTAHLAKKK